MGSFEEKNISYYKRHISANLYILKFYQRRMKRYYYNRQLFLLVISHGTATFLLHLVWVTVKFTVSFHPSFKI